MNNDGEVQWSEVLEVYEFVIYYPWAGSGASHAYQCEIDVPTGCMDNSECDEDEYCHFEDFTCGSAGPGDCEPVAEICFQVWQPVCDCNGNTRSNTCAVAQDWPDKPASSIAYMGEC